MRKEVKDAIKELCVRTRDIRNVKNKKESQRREINLFFDKNNRR